MTVNKQALLNYIEAKIKTARSFFNTSSSYPKSFAYAYDAGVLEALEDIHDEIKTASVDWDGFKRNS